MNEKWNQSKATAICLICGIKGDHNILITSCHSIVPASGTQLSNFLFKIIGEEPCYSMSEVLCQACFLLVDRLDTYQARAAEIVSHLSERYKETKLDYLGCQKRISDLLVNSLVNMKSLKNGTILNVSDELSVTVFHEAMPRRHQQQRNLLQNRYLGLPLSKPDDEQRVKFPAKVTKPALHKKPVLKKSSFITDKNSLKRKTLSSSSKENTAPKKIKKDSLEDLNLLPTKVPPPVIVKSDVDQCPQLTSARSQLKNDLSKSPDDDDESLDADLLKDASASTSPFSCISNSDEETDPKKQHSLPVEEDSDLDKNSASSSSSTDSSSSSESSSSSDSSSESSIDEQSEEDKEEESLSVSLQRDISNDDSEQRDNSNEDSKQQDPIESSIKPDCSNIKTEDEAPMSEAALIQSSLASSLLQSFLSTSMWMNPSDSNQDKSHNYKSECEDVTVDNVSETVGAGKDKQKRLLLKNTGKSYINTKGKLVDAKRVSQQDCSRCPLKCNNRIGECERQAIFDEYWGLGDYDLQREYLARHMEREERVGPSGLSRTVISYCLSWQNNNIQVCRQFFLKTLAVSEKASRLVLEKKVKGELGYGRVKVPSNNEGESAGGKVKVSPEDELAGDKVKVPRDETGHMTDSE